MARDARVSSALADSTLLLVQHQLANQAAQADALVHLGADPRDIHWLDVPYTSHRELREHVIAKLGVPPSNFTVCDDYRVLHPYAPYQHRRAVQVVLEIAASTKGPIIALDDGAYVLEALPALRPERRPTNLALVEQTTRGLIKLRQSHALKAVVSGLPFVDVAGSSPKRTLEPPFIAMAVCASLARRIRARLGSRALRRCLVLGYGAIGEQVATYLTRQFGVARGDVYVHDADSERNAIAARRGFALWDRASPPRSSHLFDLVVGCSGQSSFALGDYVHLEDGALLASASSGAVELSRADFIELADASELDDIAIERRGLDAGNLHADITFALVDRTATFMNAGFPINFDSRVSSIPGRYIQPTPVMMCAATIQARQALHEGGAPCDRTRSFIVQLVGCGVSRDSGSRRSYACPTTRRGLVKVRCGTDGAAIRTREARGLHSLHGVRKNPMHSSSKRR